MGAEMGVVFNDDVPPIEAELTPEQREVFEKVAVQRNKRGANTTAQEVINEYHAQYKLKNSYKSSLH